MIAEVKSTLLTKTLLSDSHFKLEEDFTDSLVSAIAKIYLLDQMKTLTPIKKLIIGHYSQYSAVQA